MLGLLLCLPPGAEAAEILHTDLAGLSGLGADPEGRLWTVPERTRVVLPLRVEGTRVVADGKPVPLRDVPAGADTESLAWLSSETLAMGTETRARRDGDAVLLVRREEDAFRVFDRIELPYAFWGLTPEPNRGIEGLCAAGNRLVAGLEVSARRDGERDAPLAIFDLETKTWSFGWLRLTSERGKISALTCRVQDGDGTLIEVRAIERHFGVSRLLAFTLPSSMPETPIEPKVVRSLLEKGDGAPNYEGLAWLPDGRLVLVADNHFGRVSGPVLTRVLEPEERARPESSRDSKPQH